MVANFSAGPWSAAATDPGTIPDTNTQVIQSISYGINLPGTDGGDGPTLLVHVDLASDIIADIDQALEKA